MTAPIATDTQAAQKAAVARAVQSADQARQRLHKELAQNPQAFELPAPPEVPIFRQAQAWAIAGQIDAIATTAIRDANSGELVRALTGFREAAALTLTALEAEGRFS